MTLQRKVVERPEGGQQEGGQLEDKDKQQHQDSSNKPLGGNAGAGPDQDKNRRAQRFLECVRKGILVSLVASERSKRRSDVVAYALPPSGSVLGNGLGTPAHSLGSTVHYTEYLAEDFRMLRMLSKINEVDYCLSLSAYNNYKELSSSSNSGAMFFITHDGRYLVKTHPEVESKQLRRMIPTYVKYIKDNPNTLLVKIQGLYSVRPGRFRRRLYFAVLDNMLRDCSKPDLLYDLKGSTVGRKVETEGPKAKKCRKDLNFREDGTKLELGPGKDAFVAQLRKDVEFLSSLSITDYSVLVAICKGSDGKATYKMGIIDYGQDYNWRKRFGRFVKGLIHDPKEISLIAPDPYAERLRSFVEAQCI